MADSLPIDEVARRTGLSSRALRFYEARGLVAPLRTGSGRRVFDSSDLERLNRIIALKQAGFSLSAIARILDGDGGPDLSRVLAAQLAALEAQQADLQIAADTLRRALSRIDEGERLDAATLCSLIDKGKHIMTEAKQWEDLTRRYLSTEGASDFAQTPPPQGFDQEPTPRNGQRSARKSRRPYRSIRPGSRHRRCWPNGMRCWPLSPPSPPQR